MGTREYLNKLDLEQLIAARVVADELIAAKKQEPTRVVWCLEDRDTRLECFSKERYLKAAEKLLETARENAKNKQGNEVLDAFGKELHLVPVFVPESEYAGWGVE